MIISEGLVEWPQSLVDEYQRAGFWNGKTLGSYIWDSAERYGNKIAVVDNSTRISYGDLALLTDGLSENLLNLGFRRGDTIVVQLPNCWQFLVLTLACLRIGVVPVMALPGHRRHELHYLVEHSGASAIVVPDYLRGFDHQSLALELRERLECLEKVLVVGDQIALSSTDLTELIQIPSDAEQIRNFVDRDGPSSQDVAVFLLSGGTTGLPKLIPRSHDDYGYNVRASSEVCKFDSSTVYLVSLPASHNFPLACPGILGTLYSGGTVVMAQSPEPERCFSLIQNEGVTVTALVPAIAQRWLDEIAENPKYDISSLKVLQVGGARMASELARRVKPNLGCTLQQVFGMAEGLLNYTRLDDTEDVICETQGRPVSSGDEILIVDEFDNPVPDGEMGQLLTRGPYTLRGYYKAPDHNHRAFTLEGWYRTGDVVRRHESGNLIVEGRTKDLINRGGEKISAEEIENLIYRLPSVAQVAAVAIPDSEMGERVCVVVVLRDKSEFLTLGRLNEALAAFGVAKYKFPERLEIVESLPMTNVGKIDKKRLRDELSIRPGNPVNQAGGKS